MSSLPPTNAQHAALDADAGAQAIVLRDVVMQGQVALTRPRAGRASGVAPNVGPGVTQRAAQNDVHMHAPQAPRDLAQAEEEARRRGYDEGFAKGSIEGRARGDEEARRAAAEASEKAARELEDRAERVTRELKQQAQAGYQARVQVIEELIAALPSRLEARLATAEDDMLALCFEVVCRVLGESVARPEALRAQLVRAMDRLRGRQLLAVHMHPDDLAKLQKSQGPAQGLPGGADVQWVANPDVMLGGCIVQSPEGGLDARFETQLDALRELLLQTRAVSRPAEA